MKKQILLVIAALFFMNTHAQKFEQLAKTPPMGWNSWNAFGCEINEEIIKRTADAMVTTGLSNVGYEYIIIDDCWQVRRDENGNIIADPVKFPSGIKALADYIHSKGLKFGIYSCAGDKTCGGKPGSRGHEFQDARTYADWGVDYLKYDWCYSGTQNAEAAYTTMRDALYAAKRPVVFSICEWGSNQPWLWGKDVGHLWRTTVDINPCANCNFKNGVGLGWLQILEKEAPLYNYASPGHWNDPDMLEVGNGHMSSVENKSHFTMWCMLAAPLILGNNFSAMSDETLKILSNEEVIAINQDPSGKQAYRFVSEDGVDVWVKPLSGQRFAIAVLNKNKDFCEYQFDWVRWGKWFFSDPSDKDIYKIYNVWEGKEKGTVENPFKAQLEGHDVILLLLSKK